MPSSRAVVKALRALTAIAPLLAVAEAAEGSGRNPPSFGATRPAGDSSPLPTLQVRSAAVLASQASWMHAQGVFDKNYPALETALAVGVGGGLEVSARGLFRHQRVKAWGQDRRLDSDAFEAGSRWGTGSWPAGGGTSAAAGIETSYSRTKDSGGGYAFADSRWGWADTTVSVGDGGNRLTAAFRILRSRDDPRNVTAIPIALELSPIAGVAPVGDYAFLLGNPDGWRRPWSAGLRVPVGRSWLVCYASNTAGTTAAESLAGIRTMLWNVRLHAAF